MTLAETINSWELEGLPEVEGLDFGNVRPGPSQLWFVDPKTGKTVGQIINIAKG